MQVYGRSPRGGSQVLPLVTGSIRSVSCRAGCLIITQPPSSHFSTKSCWLLPSHLYQAAYPDYVPSVPSIVSPHVQEVA
jgi:hypothetical protein